MPRQCSLTSVSDFLCSIIFRFCIQLVRRTSSARFPANSPSHTLFLFSSTFYPRTCCTMKLWSASNLLNRRMIKRWAPIAHAFSRPSQMRMWPSHSRLFFFLPSYPMKITLFRPRMFFASHQTGSFFCFSHDTPDGAGHDDGVGQPLLFPQKMFPKCGEEDALAWWQ